MPTNGWANLTGALISDNQPTDTRGGADPAAPQKQSKGRVAVGLALKMNMILDRMKISRILRENYET